MVVVGVMVVVVVVDQSVVVVVVDQWWWWWWWWISGGVVVLVVTRLLAIPFKNTSGRAPSQAREYSQHSLPGHLPNRPWPAKQAITHTIHYKSSLQERLRKISARCPPQKNHLLTKSPPFSKVRHMCMSQASWFC
jgi:hypothetical protein